MRVTLIFMILVLFKAPCFAEDKVYSYIDETGQRIYTNEKNLPVSSETTPRSYQRPTVAILPQPGNGVSKGWYERRDPVTPSHQIPPPQVNQLAASAPKQNYKHISDPIKAFASFLGNMLILMILFFIFWLVALIDILRHEFTGSNKVIWFFAVTLLPVIGPALYYFIGSDQKVIDLDRIERPTDY